MKEFFKKNDLITGRMLSFSKSAYREKYPENEVYFNANIFVLGEGKVWFGDIDVTKDMDVLKAISSESGKDLFILREMDGRFENEILKDSEIISKAVCKISK
jgi:hypothetical protein